MTLADETTDTLPEADSGPRDRAGTERLCVATRSVLPVDAMIRFVVGPDDALVADLKRKLPGRGVWVSATADAVARAVARNAFARSLRRPVRVPQNLAEETGALLERAAFDALGIAQKSGAVVTGFTKVEQTLEAAAAGRQSVVALIAAADAAANGVRKMQALVRRLELDDRLVPVMSLTGEQLDLALGRPNGIHAALLAGPASGGFLARYRKLAAYRGDGAADTAAVARP